MQAIEKKCIQVDQETQTEAVDEAASASLSMKQFAEFGAQTEISKEFMA